MNYYNKLKLWNDFCGLYKVEEKGVPLFQCGNQGHVETFSYGADKRILLKRSNKMQDLVIQEVEKVIEDYQRSTDIFDGLLYMMFWKENNSVVPLYIGKSEKFGKGEKNLSANIKGIRRNMAYFCRWGYNYAYHIGDLSAVVCSGHTKGTVNSKYTRWANLLFHEYPTLTPRLKRETFFWITSWNTNNIGPWQEFGPTSLAFVEYLLIGLASCVFPRYLLNHVGVVRGKE